MGTGMGREEEGLFAGCHGEFHYLFFHTQNSKKRYQMIGSKGKQSMIGYCYFSTTQELDLKKFALSPRSSLWGERLDFFKLQFVSILPIESHRHTIIEMCCLLMFNKKNQQFFLGYL